MSSGDKGKLDGVAAGAEVNVQPDWNAASGDAAILNKPALAPANAEQNVQSDWDATTGDAFIRNKPDVLTKAEAESSTSQVEGTVTGQRLAQAVAAHETTRGTLTGVASQSALNAISTDNVIAMALVTTAFGSYTVNTLLFYDHAESQWESAGALGTGQAAATNLGRILAAAQITITSSSGADVVVRPRTAPMRG